MANINDDFFKKKHIWSEVKDDLLAYYFKPYFSKILYTRKPIVYVDCFAGKGKFDDGNLGSPMIILDIIDEKLANNGARGRVATHFIELHHAEELKNNLKKYPNSNVISGNFTEEIYNLLPKTEGQNLFLYIDPYGVKDLKSSVFDELAAKKFYSVELLINMNSFGFFREACRALGVKYISDSEFEDLIEYSPAVLDSAVKSIDELDEVAGGEYWHEIVDNYKKELIDGYEAEDRFTKEYCKMLGENYKFVLNMPIRLKRGQRPKYRMIHATNHPEGCILMANNIHERWKKLSDIQSNGQLAMWEEDCENKIIDMEEIKEKVKVHFRNCKKPIRLNKAVAYFYVRYGVICSTRIINDILKDFEKQGKIEIMRNPPYTTNGQKSTFMTESRQKKIFVRWLT